MTEESDQVKKETASTNPKREESTSTNQESSYQPKEARWLNNNDEVVEEVFGFNENSELVNGRAAMIGFIMLILTELAFHGEPVTRSIFGIK